MNTHSAAGGRGEHAHTPHARLKPPQLCRVVVGVVPVVARAGAVVVVVPRAIVVAVEAVEERGGGRAARRRARRGRRAARDDDKRRRDRGRPQCYRNGMRPRCAVNERGPSGRECKNCAEHHHDLDDTPGSWSWSHACATQDPGQSIFWLFFGGSCK